MGRKAFGPSKKQACDMHHCKKKKKEGVHKHDLGETKVLHSRIDTRNI